MQRIGWMAGVLLLAAPVLAPAAAGAAPGDEPAAGSRAGSGAAPQVQGGGAGANAGAGSGVMTPPQVDPGMAKAPPQGTEFRSRVIPPPGGPGGDPAVQPK